MSDSDRYMLIFSLVIFFGMMALGLMVIHSNNQTSKYLEKLINRQNAGTTTTVAAHCFNSDEWAVFLEKKTSETPFMHFLESKTDEGANLDIYLNASAGNGGGFFIVEHTIDDEGTVQKSCIVSEGNNMKIVIPETPKPPTALTPSEAAMPQMSEQELEAIIEKATEEMDKPEGENATSPQEADKSAPAKLQEPKEE